MGLLGTNGAGKTTTLKMVTNLRSKDKGKIVIDNVSLDENPGLALARVDAALDTPSFYQELTAKETERAFRRSAGRVSKDTRSHSKRRKIYESSPQIHQL